MKFNDELSRIEQQKAELQQKAGILAAIGEQWPESVTAKSIFPIVSRDHVIMSVHIENNLPAILAAFPPDMAFLEKGATSGISRKDSEKSTRLQYPVWVCGSCMEHVKTDPIRVCWFWGKYTFWVHVPLEYMDGVTAVEISSQNPKRQEYNGRWVENKVPVATLPRMGQTTINFWGNSNLHCQTTDGDEFKNFILSRS